MMDALLKLLVGQAERALAAEVAVAMSSVEAPLEDDAPATVRSPTPIEPLDSVSLAEQADDSESTAHGPPVFETLQPLPPPGETLDNIPLDPPDTMSPPTMLELRVPLDDDTQSASDFTSASDESWEDDSIDEADPGDSQELVPTHRLPRPIPLPPRDEADAGERDDSDSSQHRGKSLHERLRNLPLPEQQKIARGGELNERIALERMYGKHVWESLLRNPRLTPPEVARIARMGTLPQPLLELVVSNASWLASAQVRRALLTNRRMRPHMVASVLRATPKAELKLMPKQTAYPPAVREAAAKLLG